MSDVATRQRTVAPPRMPRLGLRARWRATREARVASERFRRRLAERLERAVDRAAQRRAPFSSAVPVCAEAAGPARGALLDVAERLRAPRPVDPEGAWMARALLVDGAGPLYAPVRPGDLRAAALRTLRALDGDGARH
jgi:hypothetical protein